jgi:subtilisin-like proprotein convertase family protein
MILALLLALSAPDLRLELVRHSLTGSHCRYREYDRGLPTERYVVTPCPAAALAGALPVVTNAIGAEGLRSVDGRIVRRVIAEERPLEPFAYDYDVDTGVLLRRTPLFFHAKQARIFDPNPVAALNDPTLQDRNDAASAVPESAYSVVELDGLAASGPLSGPWVTMIDRQPPAIAPPDVSAPLLFDRADDGFEDVNAYFHIDRNQRYLQSLGYTGERSVAAYPVEVDAHAESGADNSFFLPAVTRPGTGTLYFGEGGTDDAEDADLLVHEYGHAILEWIAPSTFGGSFASEARAMSEGFGDYWAFSAHAERRAASGRDPFCFADWDARCWEDDASEQCGYAPGSDCLRRLDSPRTMADYETTDSSGVEHRNGTIWSSALRQIRQETGRAVADTILIESLFDVPPRPTFAIGAQRMLEADRLLYGGAHAAVICEAMTARQILAGCDSRPRGDETLFQSGEHGLPIPENNNEGVTSRITIADGRAIDQLLVRVDIAHPSRGDLRIELIGPDGTSVVLQQVSLERGADIHATYGLTAAPVTPLEIFRGRPAAGVWRLVVRDLRTRDAGTLLSWSLILRFAGDVPVTSRPRAARTQMIPVVAHLYGVGATLFVSDVRIANPKAASEKTTLIFTRSLEDGLTSFAAVDALVGPGQTVAFDDVVDRTFRTAGSGTLEILGDVVVMSRTYAMTGAGTPGKTMGQQVPANLDVTAFGGRPLTVSAIDHPSDRANIGIAETRGGSGIVRVGTRDLQIAPFSHTQFPISAAAARAVEVRLLGGNARIAAYLSQTDSVSRDPMFIPAQSLSANPRTVLAPVVSTAGVNGAEWRSDAWFTRSSSIDVLVDAIGTGAGTLTRKVTLASATTFPDVLTSVFQRSMTLAALRVSLPGNTFAATRIRNGRMSQFVPFLTPDGPAAQDLLFIESAAGYRTNIGIVSEGAAVAQVVVYDASGTEVQRTFLSTGGGVAQTAVLPQLVSGRALVEFLAGTGRAYASLIDNGTGDATYVQGQ